MLDYEYFGAPCGKIENAFNPSRAFQPLRNLNCQSVSRPIPESLRYTADELNRAMTSNKTVEHYAPVFSVRLNGKIVSRPSWMAVCHADYSLALVDTHTLLSSVLIMRQPYDMAWGVYRAEPERFVKKRIDAHFSIFLFRQF